MFRGRVRHVHFVGIGGIGMSGLAEILRTLEFDVSRLGPAPNENTRRLEALGVRVVVGHAAENVDGRRRRRLLERHRRRRTPRSSRARALEIPIIPRAEMLAELMRVKYGVTIAGSHGKTTTTSLVATVLRAAGLDPTVVVGGKVNALGIERAARRGRSLRRRGRRERRLVPASSRRRSPSSRTSTPSTSITTARTTT